MIPGTIPFREPYEFPTFRGFDPNMKTLPR